MRKIAAVLIAAILIFLPAGSVYASYFPASGEQRRSVPNVMVADEFRDSDIAPYSQAQGDRIITLDLISDTHIGAGDSEDYVRPALERINSERDQTDGVIIAGDLTQSGYSEEFDRVYSLIGEYQGDNLITVNGNHDYGRWMQSGQMRGTAIAHRNEYMKITTEKDYYSTEIKGLKVIVMGSEGNKPNSAYISDEQLRFVDEELKEGAQDGKPAFVICHWPMRNTHGERISWPIIPGGALDSSTTNKLQAILEKYDNIFYISGHLHAGLNGRLTRFLFGACCVEQHGGVTCINVPSLGRGNHLGLTSKGTGMRLTVYGDKAVIEGRNFTTGEWLDRYVYEVGLKDAKSAITEPLPAILPATASEADKKEDVAA